MVKVLAGARFGEILEFMPSATPRASSIIAAPSWWNRDVRIRCQRDRVPAPHGLGSVAGSNLGIIRSHAECQINHHRTGKSICQEYHQAVGYPVNAYQRTGEKSAPPILPRSSWPSGRTCARSGSSRRFSRNQNKGRFRAWRIPCRPGPPFHRQEAAAVGMAFSLTSDDHIYGSHRSHGEILAKGFSAIRQWSDAQLLELMKTYATAPCSARSRKGTRGRSRPRHAVLHLWGV